MRIDARLNKLEARQQEREAQQHPGKTRLYRDEAWREHAALTILNALTDGEWHQGHHTDSWRGTHGARELWPLLRETMTWEEQCDLLRALEDMGVVEKHYPFWGNNYYDIFPEYRLKEESGCEPNNA